MRIKIKKIGVGVGDALYCITNKNTEEVKNRISEIGYSTTFIRDIFGKEIKQCLKKDDIVKLELYVSKDEKSIDTICVYIDINDNRDLIVCGYYLGKITDKRKIQKVINKWFKKGELV